MVTLKILSYNIHKGFSLGGAKFVLHEIREMIRDTGVDLVFLQEVIGQHGKHSRAIGNWPTSSQYEFLADEVWTDHRYGQNAVYEDGDHGNAILSRFPIVSWNNLDISTNKRERRGLLHTAIQVPGLDRPLHACCTHLDLTQRGRMRQLTHLSQWIGDTIATSDPLIVAGDFNDWQKKASPMLRSRLNLVEVLESNRGKLFGTFPAIFPLLSLDRVYVRGAEITAAQILRGKRWQRLSDHIPVQATLHF